MDNLAMTEQEAKIAIKSLEPRLKQYAELLVCSGVNVQKGQKLLITAPCEAYEFVRLVVAAAYKAGASEVVMDWRDDEIKRLEYANSPLEYFETMPQWRADMLNSLAEDGAAFLLLEGVDPDAMKDIDPKKPALLRKALYKQAARYRHAMDFSECAWSIGGVVIDAWAQKVFPEVSAIEARYRLWDAILEVSRVNESDSQNAWELHNAQIVKQKRIMNDHHFDALHYSASNGTDFVVGLPEKHIWDGGASHIKDGTQFSPNIPTEEVFTTPDRTRADGIVYSAKPLVSNGVIIRDFWLKFENGKVVDFDAKQGKEVLRNILDTDEGARHLGECALISKNTPIAESGILFYSTLYDENASCHLALGRGFPECYEGGEDMTTEQLCELGVNSSAQHVDFMIGTDDLEITGITKDGEEVPVFVNGHWAWE